MVDDLLRLLLANLKKSQKVSVIVSGDVGAGKTTACQEIIDDLRDNGFQSGGVLSPRVTDSETTVGYDVVDLLTGERRSFLRNKPPGEGKLGRFYLQEEGLSFAVEAIRRGIEGADLVFLDEVGRMELNGQGLADPLGELLEAEVQGVYLVRPAYLGRFREEFRIEEYVELRIRKDEGGS